MLGTALALCSLRLALFATAVSDWINALLLQQCVDAASLLEEQGASGIESEWVGGCTYQKETFTFLYGAFESTLALRRCVGGVSKDVNDSVLSQTQTQRDVVQEHGEGGGGVSHHGVLDQGHPWIQRMYPAICDVLQIQ